jgi:hypothetical protein
MLSTGYSLRATDTSILFVPRPNSNFTKRTLHYSDTILWNALPSSLGFAPGFVKECTRLAAVSDKVYQLLAHGRWFSPGTPDSSTTKTCRHDIAEILLKVALKHHEY